MGNTVLESTGLGSTLKRIPWEYGIVYPVFTFAMA